MAKIIGIDLGTSTTQICRAGMGKINTVQTAVLFDSYTGDTLDVGKNAKQLYGKAPSEKDVVLPLQGGVIRYYNDTCAMLEMMLYRLQMKGMFSSFSCAISVPWGVTEVERNAFENVCVEAGAKSVSPIIDEPMAAAIGAGIDVLKSRSEMICDIGGGNIQVAAISYKGINKAEMNRIGGDDLDEAIISHIKSDHNVLIGRLSAEALKINIGSAHPAYDKGSCTVRGKNMLTGQAAAVTVRSGELREAMSETLAKFADTIRTAVEGCAPDIASDIFDNGIKLCGGSALLPGMANYLQQTVGIPINSVQQPHDCVIRGIRKIIMSSKELTAIVSSKD